MFAPHRTPVCLWVVLSALPHPHHRCAGGHCGCVPLQSRVHPLARRVSAPGANRQHWQAGRPRWCVCRKSTPTHTRNTHTATNANTQGYLPTKPCALIRAPACPAPTPSPERVPRARHARRLGFSSAPPPTPSTSTADPGRGPATHAAVLFRGHSRPKVGHAALGLRAREPESPWVGGHSAGSQASAGSGGVLDIVRALSQRLSASEKEREEESAAFNRKLWVSHRWTPIRGGGQVARAWPSCAWCEALGARCPLTLRVCVCVSALRARAGRAAWPPSSPRATGSWKSGCCWTASTPLRGRLRPGTRLSAKLRCARPAAAAPPSMLRASHRLPSFCRALGRRVAVNSCSSMRVCGPRRAARRACMWCLVALPTSRRRT